jgi:hypothetical protein
VEVVEAPRIESVLKQVLESEISKAVLIVLVWGSTIAAVFADALFRNPYPTTTHYILAFTICVMGGALMLEVGKALLGFLSSMGLAIGILIMLSSAPMSGLTATGGDFIQSLMITIILRSTFPFPFITFLVGSMIGSLLGERYLEGTFDLRPTTLT